MATCMLLRTEGGRRLLRNLFFLFCGLLAIQISTNNAFSNPPPSNNRNGNPSPFNDDDNLWSNNRGLVFSSAVIQIASSPSKSESSSRSSAPNPNVEQVTVRSRNLIQTSIAFWKKKMSNLFLFASAKKSPPKKEEDEQLTALQRVQIRTVSAPNSTILTPPLLRNVGQRSNLIGNKISHGSVQQLAQIISQYYKRLGYPLCSVTGATLTMDGECKIQTEEPRLNKKEPVAIAFAKEKVIDEVTGQYMSFREYKEELERRKQFSENIKKSDLNTTYVQSKGKTKSHVIANALALKKGEVFRWDPNRWQRVASSGIFNKILHCEPIRLEDGSAQLRIIAEESPQRRIEYGVTKSLYTGAWEGEMDFENLNTFGGGEVVSLSFKRGARDPQPSFTVRYNDDKFGEPFGFSFDAFQNYIGPEKSKLKSDESSVSNPILTRRGLTYRINSPLPPSLFKRSAFSANVEQIGSLKGPGENVVSTTINFGPSVLELANDARQSILATLTTGSRLLESLKLRPYGSTTLLARHIFPLTRTRNPLLLAFQHSFTTSSKNLPRHEATAIGVASKIRGYSSSSNGPTSSSLVGTTEIRFPFTIEKFNLGSATVVVFADWLFGKEKNDFETTFLAASGSTDPSSLEPPHDDQELTNTNGDDDLGLRGGEIFSASSFLNTPGVFRKASVGVGLRKSIQGIPMKYDFCVTQDGKVGSFLGIGGDFGVI